MANVMGNNGVVKVGAVAVAEVLQFTLTKNANVASDMVQGDGWDTHKVGSKNWTASINCFWDKTDTTGQGALDVGDEVTVHLMPGGTAVGDIDFNGLCTVTSLEITSQQDNIVTANISVQGNGALTESTL